MFSLTLKQLREQKGLSQRAFATQFGVSQGAVGMWESGQREPGFDTVKRIAVYFNVSTDYLLGKTEQRKSASDAEDNDDAGVLLDTLIHKLKKEDTIQFNGFALTRETAELLAESLEITEKMAERIRAEREAKGE